MLKKRALVGLMVASGTALSQTSTPITLKSVTGTVAGQFTNIVSVRELSDGRALVSDPGRKRIAVVDFKSGSVEQVGRMGNGPAQYLNVLQLFPLGGDSTVMPDPISHRWLMLDGATIAAALPADAIVVREIGFVLGVDRQGNILTIKPRRNSTGASDSDVVVLFSPSSARGDSIARIFGRLKAATGTGQRSVISDPAALAADGWVALVRDNPYRVEWRSPKGHWTIGPPLPGRESPVPKVPNRLWPTIAEELSMTLMVQPIPTANEKLLIRRPYTKNHPEPVYDVISHAGTIETQLALGVGESIVGFGNGTIYVSHPISNGTSRLDRYPWP